MLTTARITIAGLVVLGVSFGVAGCTPSTHQILPTVHKLSVEEKATYLATRFESMEEALVAQYPSAELPDVETVRLVTLDEWPRDHSQCLTDQGFPSTFDEDGSIQTEVPAGQEQAKASAEYVCEVRFPLDPQFDQPLNSSQLNYLYNYYVGDLTSCLNRRGIETLDPPSLQVFKSTYYSEGSWLPFAPQRIAQADWGEITNECPQLPKGLFGL